MEINPIGHIKTDFDSGFCIPRQSVCAEYSQGIIEFQGKFNDPNYFRGIENFSHLWIIWGFSDNIDKIKHPTVRPPRLGGNERLGMFATRSPFRENNLALSCVKFEKIEQTKKKLCLFVTGADMKNGSPVFDIKPYIPYTDSISNAKSSFAAGKPDQKFKVSLCDDCFKLFNERQIKLLFEILKTDPRPAYKADEDDKIYGFSFAGCELKFKIDTDTLAVIKAEKLS